MSDITTAIAEILDRHEAYELADRYYTGDVDEVFASGLQRKYFAKTADCYRLNFAASIVDAVLNRIEIGSVQGTSEAANKAINRAFEQNDLHLEADEIHRRALVYGDCYVMAWPDDSGEMLISYNSPTNMVLVYDPENPRKKQYAAKLWQTPGQVGWYLNLYYPERIVKYVSNVNTLSDKRDDMWNHRETVENPFNEVPVFHFRTNRPYGKPEHRDAYGPQDAINKLVVTQMTTVDYQGAPQRYALSSFGNVSEFEDFDPQGTATQNIGTLKNGPGELWYLNGVNTVGEFNVADPDNFWKPIRDFVRSMASLTNTPLHYFERTGNVPSGEALRTAEAPLIKKVQDRELAFGAAWRDLFRFILRTDSITSDVQVKWNAVESMDSKDAWDVALKKRAAGISLEQVLTEMGYDFEVIQLILEQRQVEQAQNDQAQKAVDDAKPPLDKHEKQHEQAVRKQVNKEAA